MSGTPEDALASIPGAVVEEKPVTDEFPDLDVDENMPTEMESLCMNCQENGLTRFLLVTIPFFKQIIVSAFSCPHCHYSNNEIAPATDIQMRGVRYRLQCASAEDADRSVVKSDRATLRVEELDFEIPPGTQKGTLSTVEGMLTTAASGLEELQPLRKIQTPEVYEKLEEFIAKLRAAASGSLPVTIILDDPTGNSFMQNPNAPGADPKCTQTHYTRTHAQDAAMGLVPEQKPTAVPASGSSILSEAAAQELAKALEEDLDARDSVLTMRCTCNSCNADGEIRMHILNIPYFKEVIIMAFTCQQCGYRTNEVKAGGGTSAKGVRHTLKCSTIEDLNRDVLKSETAALMVPDIDLEVVHGSLGGRFSTIEGLLRQVKEELKNNPWILGDSALGNNSNTDEFYEKFDAIMDGKVEFTFVLDDPLGNSFVQNLYAPDPDPNMEVVEYERTFEQNEDLGLNDMVVENYYKEEGEAAEKEEAKKDEEEAEKEDEKEAEKEAEC